MHDEGRKDIVPAPENFVISDKNLGVGSAREKLEYNIEALRCLQRIESERRQATSDEQETLSRYVGWGGLSKLFDEADGVWENEREVVRSLITQDEYAAARSSTLTSYYTSPAIIEAMYAVLANTGFSAGNVLEPSCGTGNFFGMLPGSMRESRLFGIELDPLTARISRALYPKADIQAKGFEDATFPENFFDVAIGNVPFGNYTVADKRFSAQGFLIHDYFFARALDAVRPGGIVAFITSKGTLDKKNPSVRRYLAERADLIGAIRLPNDAFAANAGTEVTSDIVFLQKRERPQVTEPDWVHLGLTPEGLPINAYFSRHPEMVLGRMVSVTTQYGREDTACMPYPDKDLSSQLNRVAALLHADIGSFARAGDDVADASVPADPAVRNFSYTVLDGQVLFRIDSRMYPATTSKTGAARIEGMIGIRDCLRELIELQMNDAPDEEIRTSQTKLNELYDAFTKRHGILNARANGTAFNQDSSYALLCALEDLDDEGNFVGKADMFTKRTIRPAVRTLRAETPSEALAVSLSEKAAVDIPFMSGLSGIAEEKLVDALKGSIYRVPVSGAGDAAYQTADEYLSGNVREKLRIAETAAAADDRFAANVEALRRVLPQDLGAADIDVRLGATWIPPEDVRSFMFELLDTPYYRQSGIDVRFSKVTAQWNVSGKNRDAANVKAMSAFGTSRASAYRIIEDALNLRDVRVFDYVIDEDGKRKPVLNKKETAIALSKQDAIKAAFKEWVFDDPMRRERLVALYNERFNSMRLRTFDGSHLTFPGMNPEIKLRPHQINAIARMLYAGNTLLAHEVGAGKTYEMVAASQELKRIGLCTKSLFVVPNHLTGQWAAEYLRLYPAANILVATKRDFERTRRRTFCARIATGDYDAVIIGHSQFEKIPISDERQRRMLEREIEEVAGGIRELKRECGERFSVKQLELTKKKLETRLRKLNDKERKDDVITFEELGVDRLFIDEAHAFKNLFFYTKMRNVGGVPQSEAQKSSDLYAKCRYLDEITGEKGVVFATGTPISNSMVELYTMQRYLQHSVLARLGLSHFDCWASTFGETVSAIELAPEGTGYRQKTRFSKFYNLPELMALFRQVADIQTADMLHLPTPKVSFHNVSVAPSAFQQELVQELSKRADRVRNREVDSETDNMLLITNDGRKLALDQRLANDMLPDFEGSKLSICCDNVFRIWEAGAAFKLTQLVFCDLSTPKTDGTFSVYNDLRRKLVERGVPEGEIAFIHDANSEAKKTELFGKVNSGQVRVLMGSTAKMGAGTNVQSRLVALHDLDCPWRPSDLQQRLGRIERQGNGNEEVEVYRYVTEGTFDAYLYQLVENKQRFIGQIMTSKSPVRSASDIDETALSYAELKALATGNPLIKERMDLEVDVSRLRLLKANHLSQRYALEDRVVKEFPQKVGILEGRIKGIEADVVTVGENPRPDKDGFKMDIDGVRYAERTDAGDAILAACRSIATTDETALGTYRGFALGLSFDSLMQSYLVSVTGERHYKAELSTDSAGNIARIDNAIDRIPQELEAAKNRLEETRQQMKTAQAEIDKPFSKEDELQQKTARLSELDKLLDMDKTDETQLVDDGKEPSPRTRKETPMER